MKGMCVGHCRTMINSDLDLEMRWMKHGSGVAAGTGGIRCERVAVLGEGGNHGKQAGWPHTHEEGTGQAVIQS